MSRYSEYVKQVNLRRVAHPEWREGQTYFNVLYFDGYDPTFADEIRGGDLDPFYRDDVVPALLAAVEAHWDREPTEAQLTRSAPYVPDSRSENDRSL